MRVAMVVRVIVAVIVPAMRVIVVMTVRMAMMVVMPMMMIVMRMILRGCVSAAFRLERRFDQRRLGAKRGEQGFDRVIALRADAVGQ